MADTAGPISQVNFLPWADLVKEIQIGPVSFQPFKQMKQKIDNVKLRDHLDRIFRCHVDHENNPVSTVTVCSHGLSDFRQLNDEENSDIRMAVDALIFSIICPSEKNSVCINNPSWGSPSADQYELVTQSFRVGSNDVAIRAGNLIHGGWKIDQVKFPMPWATGGGSGAPDDALIHGLGRAFEFGVPSNERERIFQSFEWFRLAHVENDVVSPKSKVVMMCTALEILLAVPESDKKNEFCGRVERYINTSKSIIDSRIVKNRPFSRSLAGWWAREFYELRSKIVHGDEVRANQLLYRDWVTHSIVADLVFWECVSRVLYSHRCIGANVRSAASAIDNLFPEDANHSSESSLIPWFLGFSDYHRALGWSPELSAESHSAQGEESS